MRPDQLIFMDMEASYYGDSVPSSDWRMHSDIYARYSEAAAVVHAHPTYSTALSCQRRAIPSFHYMVAAIGGKEIPCADYAGFGTQELSDSMLSALGTTRSVLLANHGMICYGPSLDKALWFAVETECLARQYVCALSTGTAPELLPSAEMDVMLAKFKTYGKQSGQLADLSDFERQHAVRVPSQKPSPPGGGAELPLLPERRKVIDTCLKMNAMGINQGTSGNISCRVSGGFLITASGVPYERMRPEQVVFMDLDGFYYGDFAPSSEWRMHYDIYKRRPEALAVVHAHPTYCTALACQGRGIPGFHHTVAAAGGREITCAEYASFGTQELSDSMIVAFGSRRSVLLANHGMICYGPDLDKALWLANETESLARQYVSALSMGEAPALLPAEEMDDVLSRFAAYSRPPDEESVPAAPHRHGAPRFAGPLSACGEAAPPAKALKTG